MTNLERRALLGDRQAQEECTRQGILLPCPFCGGEAELIEKNGLYTVVCKDGSCISSDIQPEYGKAMVALADWNNRQAQPIGRCQICKNSPDLKTKTKGMRWCRKFRCEVKPNGFCDNFKPKDGEEDAES